MSAYILILYFATASAQGGMTLTTAEFASQPACEAGAVQAKKLGGLLTFAKHVCVPKATP